MPTEDLNYIESLLEFSQQQDELIAGHQKEMSQVLANNEHLRTALAREYNRANQLEEEVKSLKAQLIAISEEKKQLQAENQELRNRPNIQAETYIEQQSIAKQYNYPIRSYFRTTKYNSAKISNTTQTQLQLWNSPSVSSM